MLIFQGMDVLASLLCQSSSGRDLEQLVSKLATLNTQCSEVYVVYGYLAKLNRNLKEALQFAAKAESLAKFGTRQRCEALVLKAQILMDSANTKRGYAYRDLNSLIAEALLNDTLNIQCYELFIKGCLNLVPFPSLFNLLSHKKSSTLSNKVSPKHPQSKQ